MRGQAQEKTASKHVITAKQTRVRRAFTMVELMVALTAGLVVGAAVMGLSRIATHTFNEEVRTTGTEMSIRVASDRLRGDLSRAAYMSTPNGRVDPLLISPAGNASIDPGNKAPNGLGRLASINLNPGGSYNTYASLKLASDAQGLGGTTLSPDSITLGGNFTTADEYIVQSVALNAGPCGGGQITLSRDSAALLRLTYRADGTAKTDAEATQSLFDAFQPISTPGNTPNFMARLTDDTGRSQFVILCPQGINVTTGIPTIAVHNDTPILGGFQTGTRGGTTGLGVGRMTVNPVQLVRWEVRPDATNPEQFNLVRTWLDAYGNVVNGGTELIAEYAVDLKFAFSVEDRGAAVGGRYKSFPFNDAQNTTWGTPVGSTTNLGPHLIRSVRFRVALRAAVNDRVNNIASPGEGYLYRYCMDLPTCTGPEPRYARVRTITGEVALPNQQRIL